MSKKVTFDKKSTKIKLNHTKTQIQSEKNLTTFDEKKNIFKMPSEVFKIKRMLTTRNQNKYYKLESKTTFNNNNLNKTKSIIKKNKNNKILIPKINLSAYEPIFNEIKNTIKDVNYEISTGRELIRNYELEKINKKLENNNKTHRNLLSNDYLSRNNNKNKTFLTSNYFFTPQKIQTSKFHTIIQKNPIKILSPNSLNTNDKTEIKTDIKNISKKDLNLSKKDLNLSKKDLNLSKKDLNLKNLSKKELKNISRKNLKENTKKSTTKSNLNSNNSNSFSSFSSSFISENNNRKKTYVVNYIPKWHLKNKIIQIKMSKEIISNQESQINLINDQICILNDNIRKYKSNFFTDKNLVNLFKNSAENIQIKINKLLEETIGLIIEISYLLLIDYDSLIDKFISNPMLKPTHNHDKFVEDEIEEFKENVQIFNQSSNFLNVCFDSYLIITKDSLDFIIKKYNFIKIIQFLERCRLNISNLFYTTKNIYKKFEEDEKIVNNFLKSIEKYKNDVYNKIMNNEKPKKNNINNYHNRNFSGGIDIFNYKGPKNLRLTMEREKKHRLEIALGTPEKFRQFKFAKKFDINSKLVDDLLKYSTPEFRQQIFCERIIQRFKEKENQQDEIDLGNEE